MRDFTDVVTALILPPGGTIVLLALGLALIVAKRRSGWYIATFALFLLWFASTDFVGARLLAALGTPPASKEELREVKAIVTLGGNLIRRSPEFGADVATGDSLARLRYASALHRETGAPILLAGGKPEGASLAEAEVLASALRTIYRVEPRWIESKSGTTAQSAKESYKLLHAEGVASIALVTAPWHMPRAARAFRKAGFKVVPAATNYPSPPNEVALYDFLPSANGAGNTAIALREILGLVWYRMNGYI